MRVFRRFAQERNKDGQNKIYVKHYNTLLVAQKTNRPIFTQLAFFA